MPNLLVEELVNRAEEIRRTKDGKALDPEEIRILKADGFLRQIAPYLFSLPKGDPS